MVNNIWKKIEKEIIFNDRFNAIDICLDRWARLKPEKIAFVFENHKKIEYTYLGLLREVNKFANLLNLLGIRRNSRIFIFLPKEPYMYISFLGIIKQGSIAVPLFEAFQKEGLMLRLIKGEANVIVTNKELFKRIPSDVKKIVKSLKKIIVVDSEDFKQKITKQKEDFKSVLKKKEDTMFMIFTSSTAGTPVAGIQIPHKAIIHYKFTAEKVLNLDKDTNYWCTAHPGWVTGSAYGILAPLLTGCSSFVLEGRFDSKKWMDFLKRNKISIIYTAPTVLRLLKDEIKKEDLAFVKNIFSVGEPLTKSIFEFYKKSFGIEIGDTYWQSETGGIVIANYKGLKKKPGSIGKPIPGIKAKIKNGMIMLKKDWPALMTGIYKHSTMYKGYFEGKWFKTNDMAFIDKEGYYFFEGRKDDIIKTSGERVSPIEIESVLLKHPAVKETAVIGIPDSIRGQIIKAFVVLNREYKANENLSEELKKFVKENYAGHSYPKEIEFLEELPKTNSGKIIKSKLRINSRD